MRERLQKALATAGVASRRRAEGLIAAGDVTVNGRVATLGETVDPEHDRIEVCGTRLQLRVELAYLALNKPAGYVTTLRATHGEKTVSELIDFAGRVFPVGRLDRETTGLLLLTNDGEWGNLVTHPRYRVEKEYVALVRGRPSAEALRVLRSGVRLHGGMTVAPAQVRVLAREGADTLLSVTVIEGKKRQIRLMAAAVGHPVIALERVRIGAIHLGGLPAGSWRHLRSEEIEGIRHDAGHPGKARQT